MAPTPARLARLFGSAESVRRRFANLQPAISLQVYTEGRQIRTSVKLCSEHPQVGDRVDQLPGLRCRRAPPPARAPCRGARGTLISPLSAGLPGVPLPRDQRVGEPQREAPRRDLSAEAALPFWQRAHVGSRPAAPRKAGRAQGQRPQDGLSHREFGSGPGTKHVRKAV
jgi:hypothetical protein